MVFTNGRQNGETSNGEMILTLFSEQIWPEIKFKKYQMSTMNLPNAADKTELAQKGTLQKIYYDGWKKFKIRI